MESLYYIFPMCYKFSQKCVIKMCYKNSQKELFFHKQKEKFCSKKAYWFAVMFRCFQKVEGFPPIPNLLILFTHFISLLISSAISLKTPQASRKNWALIPDAWKCRFHYHLRTLCPPFWGQTLHSVQTVWRGTLQV